MNNFKKLDKIVFKITNNVFKRFDYNFIKISENWNVIVGKEFSKFSYPTKIGKDNSLSVVVESKVVTDFEYASPKFIRNMKNILGKEVITRIKVLQKPI